MPHVPIAEVPEVEQSLPIIPSPASSEPKTETETETETKTAATTGPLPAIVQPRGVGLYIAVGALAGVVVVVSWIALR